MSTTIERAETFFEQYELALLARDADAIALMYSVPALIVFPGDLIPVVHTDQTRDFFASAFDQYEGIRDVDRQMSMIAETPGSLWVDVTWSFQIRPSERFCYQLVDRQGELQIAVLTPLQ
jgi:ketosteroid isomerase-like protein